MLFDTKEQVGRGHQLSPRKKERSGGGHDIIQMRINGCCKAPITLVEHYTNLFGGFLLKI